MRTVAFINLKGGVGKTVSAANVAHILNAYHHKKVLLVDGDKQGSASRHFGLYGEQDGTAALLLDPERDPLEAVYHTGCRGLDIITSLHAFAPLNQKKNDMGHKMSRLPHFHKKAYKSHNPELNEINHIDPLASCGQDPKEPHKDLALLSQWAWE